MENEKFLLVKGAAGLGDRILFLLSAILYARLSHRKLVVDWRDPVYSNDGSNTFNSLFECKIQTSLSALPDTNSVYPDIWRGHLDLSARQMLHKFTPDNLYQADNWRPFSADFARLDYTEDIVVAWAFYEQIRRLRRHLRGSESHYRRLSEKEILKSLIRENLAPSRAVRERLEQFKKEYFTGEMVGVHARFTDRRTRIPVLHKRLKRLLARNPGSKIFLATDNRQVENLFKDTYSNVITLQKWYPEENAVLHHSPDCPDRVELALSAALDIYLLASCRYLIVDERSSFSYVASLLSGAPPENIRNISPARFLPASLRRSIWITLIRARKIFRTPRPGIE